jgi:hypothetical protein
MSSSEIWKIPECLRESWRLPESLRNPRPLKSGDRVCDCTEKGDDWVKDTQDIGQVREGSRGLVVEWQSDGEVDTVTAEGWIPVAQFFALLEDK